MSSPLLNYSIYSILILFMHYIFLHPLCNSLLWMTFFWQIGWRLRQEWDNYCMKDIHIVFRFMCMRRGRVHGTIECVWIMYKWFPSIYIYKWFLHYVYNPSYVNQYTRNEDDLVFLSRRNYNRTSKIFYAFKYNAFISYIYIYNVKIAWKNIT